MVAVALGHVADKATHGNEARIGLDRCDWNGAGSGTVKLPGGPPPIVAAVLAGRDLQVPALEVLEGWRPVE